LSYPELRCAYSGLSMSASFGGFYVKNLMRFSYIRINMYRRYENLFVLLSKFRNS